MKDMNRVVPFFFW